MRDERKAINEMATQFLEMNMSNCANCVYFKFKAISVDNDTQLFKQLRDFKGRCFRHPPTMDGRPETRADGFCGEHSNAYRQSWDILNEQG